MPRSAARPSALSVSRVVAYIAVGLLLGELNLGLSADIWPSPKTSPSVAATPVASASPSDAASPDASASPSDSPSPDLSPSPAASYASITAAEGRALLRDFLDAHRRELHALEARQSTDLRELKSFQALRLKEWKEQENAARRKYFEEHLAGAERRAYMKDRGRRYEAFRQILSDERATRVRENEARVGSLKSEQAARLMEFKEFLDRGQRPPAELWPRNH
jgi:hypothetical protein